MTSYLVKFKSKQQFLFCICQYKNVLQFVQYKEFPDLERFRATK